MNDIDAQRQSHRYRPEQALSCLIHEVKPYAAPAERQRGETISAP